jgi:protein-disulfide isomerase
MTDSFRFDSLRRRFLSGLIGTSAAFALIACGGGDTENITTTSDGVSKFETATDHAIGSIDAPVTIVEYASVTCPHCANWSSGVYPDLKKKYIDTGKVRYVFRPFPTPPQELADAGHMIALCAGDEQFLTNIKYQFDRQQQILGMAQQGKAREAYISIAKNSGLSESEFEACLINESIQEEYQAVVQGAFDIGITGTPAFLVNGEYIKKTPSGKAFYTLESIEEVILPILGEPIPETATDTETSE